jgi:exportin-2 (importin alpha re-exporter)
VISVPFWYGKVAGTDLLGGQDEDKPGILLKVKADICQNLTVYVEKYEEEFQPFIGEFMKAVWNLLTKIDPSQPKYDSLLARGMQMLTMISKGVAHEQLSAKDSLTQICERLVIPNMRFRDNDEINFEENPTEYIRADLEDSNLLTSRSSAAQLVQGLRRHNEANVTQIFASYVMNLLNSYASNPSEKWSDKDVAFHLISALAISGSTRMEGTTSVNEHVPIGEFFNGQVLTELKAYPNNHAVIQADSLKFICSFRSLLPANAFPSIIEAAVKMISSPVIVVASYAAACIERLLTVKEANRSPRFGAEALEPFILSIFTAAFGRLAKADCQNNEYLMRLIMRVLDVSKGRVASASQQIMSELVAIIERIVKAPTIPAFDHYVFESVACLCSCLYDKDPAMVAQFEAMILPTMTGILQNDTASK